MRWAFSLGCRLGEEGVNGAQESVLIAAGRARRINVLDPLHPGSSIADGRAMWVPDDSLDTGDVDLDSQTVTIRAGGGGHFEWVPNGSITTYINQRQTLPQKPFRILDRDEVSTLVDEVRKLFSARPGCEEWTNKLLGELANATGFNAGTIEDILSSFSQSGVIVSNGSVVGTGGGSTGTALGYPAIDLTFGNTPQHTASSLLHEIIHWAGLQSGRSLYDDTAQAAAWNKLGVVMSAEQYRTTFPDVVARNRQRDGYDYAESRLAGAAQDIACLDAKPQVRILK